MIIFRVIECTPDFDYESLTLDLNLDVEVARLEDEESLPEDAEQNKEREELDEETRKRLEFSKSLDDIYRKHETSSYTKQINLKLEYVTQRKNLALAKWKF